MVLTGWHSRTMLLLSTVNLITMLLGDRAWILRGSQLGCLSEMQFLYTARHSVFFSFRSFEV